MNSDGEWNQLTDACSETGVVLCIGAGVSAGCRLPNWSELLRRLAIHCWGAEAGAERFEQLIDSGVSLPAIAGILEHKRPHDFSDLIRQALYRDFPFFPKYKRDRDRDEFIRFVTDNNMTMRTVAAMCASKREHKNEFRPNPAIRAVLNLNLDSVLTSFARARYRTRIFRTVERASKGARPGLISMYHIHGHLTFDESKFGKLRREGPDLRVLTEQDYFDFFNRPNSIFHYTFLYLLREHSCLFVGLSMTDENIRRMLHYSQSERLASYRTEGRNPTPERSLRHFAILNIREKTPELRDMTESSLGRLGVRVLWIDGFEALPERIGTVYKAATGKSWSDVYE
jgi:hypothetical protein